MAVKQLSWSFSIFASDLELYNSQSAASQAETQHSSMPTRLCELFEDVSALTHIHCWIHSVFLVGLWGVAENVWRASWLRAACPAMPV